MDDPLADPVLLADLEHVAHAHRRFSNSSQKARAQAAHHAATSPDPAGAADPDTCRICRGEATEDEPLFYPCKCSGSIKFVHQNCLMEWLSHSQKKHCELCKTPFRFTKLYDRRMPQTLPFAVFVSHVAKYLLANLLGWLRAALVISIWLVWLPYLMRAIWSLMFWISDEGFGGGAPDRALAHASSVQAHMCPVGRDAITAAARAVCPSTPLLASVIATGELPRGRALNGAGGTFATPLYAQVLQLILSNVGLVGDAPTVPPEILTMPIITPPVPRRSAPHRSLLGDVTLFKNMTPLPWLNRNLVYVIEGQIITILVILCFILIILVRDYVVLQQPEINMRAAFAAAENQAQRAGPLGDPAAGPRPEDIDALRGPDPTEFDDDSDDDTASMRSLPARDGPTFQGVQPRVRLAAEDYVPVPIPPYRRRPAQPATDNGEESSTARRERTLPGEGSSGTFAGHGLPAHGHQDDVPAPLGPGLGAVEPLSVREFTRVYHEAQGDSDEMARLFQERGQGARAEPWLRLRREKEARMAANRSGAGAEQLSASHDRHTQTMDRRTPGQDNESTTSASEQGESVSSRHPGQSSSATDSADQEDGLSMNKGKAAADASLQLDGTPLPMASPPAPSAKGKEKAVEAPSLPDHNVAPRPRANTDGPLRHDGAHPLANNSWAFVPMDQLASSSSSARAGPDDAGRAELAPSTAELQAHNEDLLVASQASHGTQPAATDVPGEGETPAWANLPDFNDMPANPAAHDDQQPGDERQPVGILERLAEFMWRGVNPAAEGAEQRARVRAFLGDPDHEFGLGELIEQDVQDGHEGDDEARDDEHPDLGAAAPAAAAMAGPEQQRRRREQQQRDAEAVREAVAAGLDPEAIEDAEDFEGVMELLGMRGPIAGLFQNAVFCSFLVSVTVFAGIFVPYNIGRVCVWVLANPMRPVRIVFSTVKLVQDCALVAAGMASWLALRIANMVSPLLALQSLSQRYVMPLVRASYYMSLDAARRILETFTVDPPVISTSEIRNFSAVSHEALLSIKANIGLLFCAISRGFTFAFGGDYSSKSGEVASFVGNATSAAWDRLREVPGVLADPGSWVINLSPAEAPSPVNPELAYWDATDRFWAVLGGYLALCVVAALYLHRGRPFSTSASGQEREASIVDGLNQASGVMKVILIIGIEMLIFPLYCGLLLDVALLPLFEDTTLRSRVLFTFNYPLTSIFVHWFVGTGYMFHFALFVSMCRKIMRKGVLYFIRDPDDPEFHPVRDVLERNVTTQLRKILFSAFVYGALVMVCLGGVVWGLWASLPGVLPVHYSSNEPVLEFPLDLLFYNFLMPLAVKFFRPSDGLHAMYTWWFRCCARALRVTWFLFGERRIDEEGVLALGATSEARKLPFWRRLFLEVDDGMDHWAALPQTLVPHRRLVVRGVAPAAALRAIVAGGWLNPDAGVLTRAFVIPGLVLSAVAIVGPLVSARIFLSFSQTAANTGLDAAAAATAGGINPTLVYRLSFPVAAMSVVVAFMAWATLGVFRSWRVRIRDEAYLIGERLHNFGVSSSGPQPPLTPGNHNHPRARVVWREGGAVAI
ncbi:RING finger membrane protein [Magnaporthiopsis poae ATCC 64411]|uniref:RING-type E3 ubiquitin transferase n=1 Tax=Magnaporthiopsis poae (strain ATCC 64411 / 73-15) TaxID=644358 RepID=A0A0C4E9P6_MAGP6|nr:RING finger membrane protein [Magnaporthiopsis poae ATCC 64411]